MVMMKAVIFFVYYKLYHPLDRIEGNEEMF